MRWASSSPSSTISTCCVAPRTSTSVSSRRPRLAVTLGDPRGIGPEVVAKAIALGPLDADLVLVGSKDIAPRSLLPEQAGRIAGQAVEEAVRLPPAGGGDGLLPRPAAQHALQLSRLRPTR